MTKPTAIDLAMHYFARAKVMNINADYHRAMASKCFEERDPERAKYEAEIASWCRLQAANALETIAALALVDPLG